MQTCLHNFEVQILHSLRSPDALLQSRKKHRNCRRLPTIQVHIQRHEPTNLPSKVHVAKDKAPLWHRHPNHDPCIIVARSVIPPFAPEATRSPTSHGRRNVTSRRKLRDNFRYVHRRSIERPPIGPTRSKSEPSNHPMKSRLVAP